jgi:hypothetical protein
MIEARPDCKADSTGYDPAIRLDPAARMVETGTLDRIATVDEIWKTTPRKVAIIAGMIP